MSRLVLVRHAPTRATRAFVFPADELLDDEGRRAARAIGALIGGDDEVLSSPARRCLETAAAAGAVGPAVEPELAECDFGAWRGRTMAQVEEAALNSWMHDPQANPHGGESLSTMHHRVGGWLARQATRSASVLAVTHGGVIKSAIVHALGAPLEAFWRLDAAPLHRTELHAHEGRWTLVRTNCPPPAGSAR